MIINLSTSLIDKIEKELIRDSLRLDDKLKIKRSVIPINNNRPIVKIYLDQRVPRENYEILEVKSILVELYRDKYRGNYDLFNQKI